MSSTLERRSYGSTGERVTVIGLGGASLHRVSPADGVATVRRALELGVSYFDTAPAYGRGGSQLILGEALEGTADRYILASKLGYLATPEDFRSVNALWAQLQSTLRSLRRDHVDILQVHLAERACWWKDGAPFEELVSPGETYDFADAPVMQVGRKRARLSRCDTLL